MASPELAKLYLSLLMALTYVLVTSIDLHAYVVAIERHAAAPTRGRVRELNALVRWAQQRPLRIHNLPMPCSRTLDIHGDAAFRKEQNEGVEAGRAQRGTALLCLGQSDADERLSPAGACSCHLVDWQRVALDAVTRGAVTGELMSAISSAGRTDPDHDGYRRGTPRVRGSAKTARRRRAHGLRGRAMSRFDGSGYGRGRPSP